MILLTAFTNPIFLSLSNNDLDVSVISLIGSCSEDINTIQITKYGIDNQMFVQS